MPNRQTSHSGHTVHVDLKERSYPIYIDQGLLEKAELLHRHIPGTQVLVVTNETVAPLYLERVCTALAGFDLGQVILPDGEQHKTLETATRIYDALIDQGCNRSATLVGLGGGVVGDITGFVAATYQRGVHFIQIPTTLLALVDSSVGGKTGVNHPRGKNMIGAFHQPRCVLADTATLGTLPEREFRAGIAEVIKYGLIQDYAFFQWLERHLTRVLARDPAALMYIIEQSCRNKAYVVAADERESGQRALLNLGHTFGHAIETATGYREWLHGEAVAVGMCMAAHLSASMGWMSAKAFERTESLIQAAGLPVLPPPLSPDALRKLMAIDKKASNGRLRLVLLEGIGSAVVTEAFDDQALTMTLEHFTAAAGTE
ncbi:MAG: 3-dehydroquinate synthase [Nitrococcus mobilis]|nr:3-dehydroquinate synthase [Nitrococcus mobilis]